MLSLHAARGAVVIRVAFVSVYIFAFSSAFIFHLQKHLLQCAVHSWYVGRYIVSFRCKTYHKKLCVFNIFWSEQFVLHDVQKVICRVEFVSNCWPSSRRKKIHTNQLLLHTSVIYNRIVINNSDCSFQDGRYCRRRRCTMIQERCTTLLHFFRLHAVGLIHLRNCCVFPLFSPCF